MIARALWLALVVMVAACASMADAGTMDQERCCPVGNFAQKINGSPSTAVVNLPVIAPGAIVADDTGASQDVGIVVRDGPTPADNRIITISGTLRGIAGVTWTPGAGGSGDGTIDIVVMETGAMPVEDALVNVGLIAAGTIANVTATAGALTGRALSGTGADSGGVVQGLTASNGHLTLAFNGATGTALKIVVSLLPAGTARLDGLVNAQDVTTP